MKFVLIVFVTVIGFATSEDCPWDDQNLLKWSDEFSGFGNDEDYIITQPTLLDVDKLYANTIKVTDNGELVFDNNKAIYIETTGILVNKNAKLVIGSQKCPYTNDAEIVLIGERGDTDLEKLEPLGEKYVVVTDNAVLQIYGEVKTPWTKLSKTVERFTKFPDKFDTFPKEEMKGSGGLLMFEFNKDDPMADPAVEKFALGNKKEDKEQQNVDAYIDRIKNIGDGNAVALVTWKQMASLQTSKYPKILEKLLAAIRDAADLKKIKESDPDPFLLTEFEEDDVYAMAFIKGQPKHTLQSLAKFEGTVVANASAFVQLSDYRIGAYASRENARFASYARRLHSSIGFPEIELVHKPNWKVGEKILLTSTDYAPNHGEVREIIAIDGNKIKLNEELHYRHFSAIEKNVDMRGEAAFLSRKIKFRGKMSRSCPKNNGNCKDYKFDTYGGHVKIHESFASVHIEGAQFTNMGQMNFKGHYPIHFHMCHDITGKHAVVKQNTIWNSYRRCVTVHGTYGTSEEQPGVQVIENVGYDIFGHCFFLEDGVEKATILKGNLGAGIKRAKSEFVTDRHKPTIYWITNPQVIMVGNVGAGSEGMCIWYTFPLEGVGESKGLVYKEEEAKHTPTWRFDRNNVHSCKLAGFNFDNIMNNADGQVSGCMEYYPVEEPLKGYKSKSTKTLFVRLTAWKNLDINCWFRGGWFVLIQYSSADSKKGSQFARGSDQQMYVKKSSFIGRSSNYEDEDYPDAVTDADLKQYLGNVFHDGPSFTEDSCFANFKPCANGRCVAAALGFATKNKFTSSVVSNVTNCRFAFSDSDSADTEGLRLYDGVVDQKSMGESDAFEGEETATVRDSDGSLTRCPGDTDWKYPVQVVANRSYLLTENCKFRDGWNMAICKDKYAKIKTKPTGTFEGNTMEYDKSGDMRRVNRYDPDDTAVEQHDDPKSSNDVVLGVCLPEGVGKEDIQPIFRRREGEVPDWKTDFIYVNSLQEIFDDKDQRAVFLDGRFLYVKLSTWHTRNEAWDRHDTDHCPGRLCPEFRISLKNENKKDNTPCFTVKDKEIDHKAASDKIEKETCTLTSTPSQCEDDWGAGDQFADVDGQWGKWTGWADCCKEQKSTTTRVRYCDNPPKYGDGKDCPGKHEETKDCEVPCPVDGTDGEWSEWSDCTSEGDYAGSFGTMSRTRACTGTANAGTFCEMSLLEIGNCDSGKFEKPLTDPVDATRGKWEAWSRCFCDGIAAGSTGVRTRSRTCLGAKNGGKACWASLKEATPCKGDCGGYF